MPGAWPAPGDLTVLGSTEKEGSGRPNKDNGEQTRLETIDSMRKTLATTNEFTERPYAEPSMFNYDRLARDWLTDDKKLLVMFPGDQL